MYRHMFAYVCTQFQMGYPLFITYTRIYLFCFCRRRFGPKEIESYLRTEFN